ncbi:MAG: hypothetical protein U1F66_12690 [bacterium]
MNFRVIHSLGGRLPTRPLANASEAPFAPLLRRLDQSTSDAAFRAELSSLTRENDSALLSEALLNLAERQARTGRIDIAGEIYASLAAAPGIGSIGAQAERRLAALQGRGPLGERLELLGRNFARQASDPAMLGAMALGGLAFQTTRLAVLSRLAASPTASFLTRGLGARAFAWGAGFSLEFPTFTLAARGIHQAMGDSQDWSARALGRDLLSSGLTLFLLKGCGAGGSGLLRRIQNGAAAEGLFARFSAAAIPQAAAFTGILGSHLLEARLGLRPQTDGANALLDSLATLLQFHVGGRILRQATGGAYEARLDLLTRRLQESSAPPPSSESPGWTVDLGTGPRPAPAGNRPLTLPNIVLMSGPRVSPSDRPGPMEGFPERSGRIVAHPHQLRDLKAEVDLLDHGLWSIFRGEGDPSDWQSRTRSAVKELQSVSLELHRRIGQEEGRAPLQPYLQELGMEYHTILNLLERAAVSTQTPPPVDALEINRFFTFLIRSSNTLINFIDHTAPIQQPIENARRARAWLQRGLEGDEGLGDEIAPVHPNFPYVRLSDGSFDIKAQGLHILVIGDENAPRTFQLAEKGHRVTHLGESEAAVRTTEKRLRFRAQRMRDSGEWKFDPTVDFHHDASEVPPADLIEAYFPGRLTELPPRSSTERLDTLQSFLKNTLAARLARGGSAFVISERDDAIEDLGNLVLRSPGFELLEVRHRRNHMPLVGGQAATIEPGEAMVSWLVFRKTGSDRL